MEGATSERPTIRAAGRLSIARLRKPALALGTMIVAAVVATVVPIAYRSITDRLDDSPPLTAVVEVADEDCPGGEFVLPPGFDVADLPAWEDLDSAWAHARGGADSSRNIISITLQGASDDAVVLQGLRVIDLSREPAPASSVVVDKCNGGGDLYPRRFDVDLDSSPVQLVAQTGDVGIPGDGADPAIDFPYTISRTEPEVFWVTPETTSCVCSWRLALDWTSGGRSGELVLDVASEPFRTASASTTGARYQLFQDGTVEPE